MTHGICNLSLIPLRPEPSHRSEMVSQLLFGDVFEVFERYEEWIRIKCHFDSYVGWIQQVQCLPIDFTEFKEISENSHFVSNSDQAIVSMGNKEVRILLGSTIPNYKDGKFSINAQEYAFDKELSNTKNALSAQTILDAANRFLGSPYLWGGKSMYGTDCSGFVQVAFKLAGIRLWRDTHQQATQGIALSLLEETTAGDLAFFDNPEGKISHVGILLDKDKIIHASGMVRIDPIDHHGIYNLESGSYSHTLRLLRRLT